MVKKGGGGEVEWECKVWRRAQRRSGGPSGTGQLAAGGLSRRLSSPHSAAAQQQGKSRPKPRKGVAKGWRSAQVAILSLSSAAAKKKRRAAVCDSSYRANAETRGHARLGVSLSSYLVPRPGHDLEQFMTRRGDGRRARAQAEAFGQEGGCERGDG